MSMISVEAKGQKSNYSELNRSAERSSMKEGRKTDPGGPEGKGKAGGS